MKQKQTRQLGQIRQPGQADIIWVLQGHDVGSFFFLQNKAVIGRSSECEIIISDSFISRKHLKITQQHHTWYLTDLSTTNGSFLNNKRLLYAPIKNGDLLEMGETKCLILSVNATAQSPIFSSQSPSISNCQPR